MKMKRILSIALVCSMLLSAQLLSGCEKSQSGSTQRGKVTEPIVTVNAIPEPEDLSFDKTSADLGLSVPTSLKKAYKTVGNSNPISSNLFFADPTSVEYNGRLYVYGTCDTEQYRKNGKKGDNGYGGIDSLSCFSTDDMLNWTYHGDINVNYICPWAGVSWAPSIVSRATEDGTTEFFLYFTLGGGGIGVMKATSPLGPWTDPVGAPLINGQTNELAKDPICWVFDPGVVIDDYGVGWIAFGGGDPQQEGETGMNTRNCRIARLGEDMVSLDSKIAVIEAPYHFEANELNYIDGKFYLTYCSNWKPRDEWSDKYDPYPMPQHCTMCYMVSDDPLNPSSWKYKGEYLLNPTSFGYPFSNNHTHLHQFNGKNYLFYQTVLLLNNMNTPEATGYRSVCVNEISIDTKKAEFGQGTMTDKGVSQIKNFDPFAVTEGETSNVVAGVEYKKVSGKIVASFGDGSWSVITSADFKDGAEKFAATVSGKGIIDIRLDAKDGASVGSLQLDTDGFETLSCQLSEKITGVHDLYFVTGGDVQIDQWQFR